MIVTGASRYNRAMWHVTALAILVIGQLSYAGTYTENGDTGDSLGSAQGDPGTAYVLDTISGTINDPSTTVHDVDIYAIYINDEANFTAGFNGPISNTRLYLFDSSGTAIVAMGSTGTGVINSTYVTSNGLYYLAVSAQNMAPEDSLAVDLWSSSALSNLGTQSAPDGGSLTNQLAGWSAGSNGQVIRSYTISLTGVTYSPAPEPGTLVLSLVGLGIGALKSRRRRG